MDDITAFIKSKALNSCKYLEERFQECSQKEGATSVETLGVDFRKENQAVGSEGEGEKKEVRCERLAYQEKSGFPEKLHKGWCEEVVEDGSGPCESVGEASRWHRVYRKAETSGGRCQQQQARRNRCRSLSLSLFLEVNNLEVEEQLSTTATLAWVGGVWLGRWEKGAAEGLEEADLRGSDMVTSERTCRNRHARRPVTWASSGTL